MREKNVSNKLSPPALHVRSNFMARRRMHDNIFTNPFQTTAASTPDTRISALWVVVRPIQDGPSGRENPLGESSFDCPPGYISADQDP